jgi:hypothetical protein
MARKKKFVTHRPVGELQPRKYRRIISANGSELRFFVPKT